MSPYSSVYFVVINGAIRRLKKREEQRLEAVQIKIFETLGITKLDKEKSMY
jgi:hypothetical protein